MLFKLPFGKLIENIGIAESFIVAFVKCHLDDLLRRKAMFEQVFFKNGAQEIRFATTTQPGNDLNESIMLFADEFIEVELSFEFHNTCLLFGFLASFAAFTYYNTPRW